MHLHLTDTFNKELPADKNLQNTRRQVSNACFSYVTPRVPSSPKLLHVAQEVAALIGFSEEDTQSEAFLHTFSGKKVYKGTNPYAMCYGGHQFGNWAGQLGDGRAINLMEIMHANTPWTLQLKGAGETPYSRTADGLAVLRSSIREHLCSEAMHHLGVPTTRSLSLVLSGDQVLRDMLYNGNAAFEAGAIVCRVAPTFIRFGNFEILAVRKDIETLKILTDYTISHFYPHIKGRDKTAYIQFFEAIATNTMEMVLHWQRVGFVHGVMNTDNMSILGLTIDYGPYGWLEDYDPEWTPNTTDRSHKRYRFEHQPHIALWNLVQLANALYPLIEEVAPIQNIIHAAQKSYAAKYIQMMQQKLGLLEENVEDAMLIAALEQVLVLTETDMTIFFRNLANLSKNDSIETALQNLAFAFYKPETLEGEVIEHWQQWLSDYLKRISLEKTTDAARKEQMNSVNPKYVLRNYMAQLAIDAAENEDYTLIDELYTLLKKPYAEQPQHEKWFAKRPDWARHKVGCSMLSCSS
jgi:serine/tyrosine/threonine adenylyltransferase